MSSRYKLLFRGQVSADHQEPVVRARLQKILKASDAQLEVMFSGKPVTIKKDADDATVERYLDAFMKAGAKLEIVELDAEALAEAERKAKMEAAAKAHKAQLAQEAKEAQAEDEHIQDADESAGLDSAQTAEPVQPVQPSQPAQAETPAGAFALAEVGSDLVAAEAKTEPPVADVATDHLSLSEAGGNLVAATEIVEAAPAPAVDISHLKLDEPGATLGTPVPVEPAISPLIDLNFELGEVGEQLVESAPPVVAEVPDLGHFELEELPKPTPTDA